MEGYPFNDGGAFPEIHLPQDPLGDGTSGLPQPAAASHAVALRPGASAASLVPHYFTAAELARPSAEEVEINADRTRQQLEAALRAKQAPDAISDTRTPTVLEYRPQLGVARTIEIVDAPRDPLDPSRVKVKRLGREPAGDPTPVVRSPTKKPLEAPAAGSSGAPSLLSIPRCVQNWTNPRNLIIPIDQRELADGRNLVSNKMSESHFTLAEALAESERNVDRARGAREATLQKELEVKQLEEEEELAQRAQEALLKEAKRKAEERAKHRQETPEERQLRIAAEQEARDRAREAERKQRRLEKTAQKLGLTVEEVSQDALLDAVNPQNSPDASDTIGGARHHLQRNALVRGEGLYDEPLFAKRRATFRVDQDSIEAEMRRQDQLQGPPAPRPKQAADPQQQQPRSMFSGPEEDIFGVSELLARKRPRE